MAPFLSIIEKLEEFKEWIDSNFENIEKSEDIEEVKALFKSNERELIKGKNIPEDDDCRIIKGYHECIFDGSKKIISEDEHFWSYKDLILDKYEIEVIEEWNCHKIVV